MSGTGGQVFRFVDNRARESSAAALVDESKNSSVLVGGPWRFYRLTIGRGYTARAPRASSLRAEL